MSRTLGRGAGECHAAACDREFLVAAAARQLLDHPPVMITGFEIHVHVSPGGVGFQFPVDPAQALEAHAPIVPHEGAQAHDAAGDAVDRVAQL
jgi:hypothetical protein